MSSAGPVIAGDAPVSGDRLNPLSDNNSLGQSPVSPVSPVLLAYTREALRAAIAGGRCPTEERHTGDTGDTGDSDRNPLLDNALTITGVARRTDDLPGNTGDAREGPLIGLVRLVATVAEARDV